MTRYSRLLSAAVLGLTTIHLPWTSSLAETDMGVDIDLGVIRSDNIFLAPDGLETSETVYTIAPEFYLNTENQRLAADIRYRPEAYFYSEFDEADDVFHMLNANATATLVRDRLFLLLRATNFQSIITPEGRIPGNNLPISGNRTDSRVLEARPYWQQRIGQADLLVQAGYMDIDYSDSRFQSSNELHGYFRLGNVQRQQGVAWQVDYQYRRTEYEISTPWDWQRASLNLGFWIDGTFRLFAVGGAETSIENLFESNMDSEFWEAGFQYAPNQRLNLEMAVGDRSYGTSFRTQFSYDMRRGDISFSYNEGPEDRSALAFSQRPPLEGEDDLDGAVNRPGDSDRFIRKRGELRSTVELTKSNLTLRIFAESREDRTTPEGQPLEDETLAGAAVRWSWQFGNKTTFGANADVADREYSNRDDRIYRFSVDLEYSLSRRISLRAEVARFDQEGKQSDENDYTEHQYRLYLRTSF